ncbi:MAG TPA: glycosyltransferase [Gaiellaceae bacterium]|nr:glycosyltransferase [Gaiellaceae bacterium]
MAVAIADRHRPGAESAAEAAFRVIWLGERPWWLDDPQARAELDGIEPGPPVPGRARPFVVHARASVLHTLRRASHERLIADISGTGRLDRVAARVARSAQVVLVDDPGRLPALRGRPSSTWSLLRTPLDLEHYAPERVLHERRDAALKRFRRLHRLSPRTLLYAGPYRPEGGLHVLLELAERLRARYDDLVVAAIPEGEVDARYRDACERRALALGHRALIEWEVSDADRPLWYALAAVVCIPATGPVPVAPVLRAAAAGVPLVAGAVEPYRALPPEFGGELVPVGDVRSFAARIEQLLDDAPRAHAAGAQARRTAEKQLSPAAAARALRTLWSGLAPPG